MPTDYKVIEMETPKGIKKTELELLESVSSKYPKEDIYFEFINKKLCIYLNKLDFATFKRDMEWLIDSKEIHNLDFFFSVLNSIENIKSYGLKGAKRTYVGYNNERKVKDRALKEKRRQAYFYAKTHNFSAKNNVVPESFVNQVICGDSENILKTLPDNCVDLIFTSPPYNFGLDYMDTNDDFHWKRYFDKLFSVFSECIRVTKYGGRIIVNVQPLFSDYIPTHHIISNFFMENKLIWKGEVVWEKHNYNCKYTAWGSWKSPSNPYLKYTWEFLEIFCKGALKKEGKQSDADISADEFKKWVLAKWAIAPERNMKKHDHPAMFPEELAARVLKLFSFKKDVILDPFNGVGTTTCVAKNLGRRYIGIDISEEYCKTARNRIPSSLFQ